MNIIDRFMGKNEQEPEPSLDEMVNELDKYMQVIKMEQKNASRISSVCDSAINKIVVEKQELFLQVRRLMGEGKDDRAKSYIASMQKLEMQENMLSKEKEIYKQRVFEYIPLVIDVDVMRKDLLYKKALNCLNPEIKNVNLSEVISGFERIKQRVGGNDISEPIQLKGYMMSKENMLDAQAEIGDFDIYDEDVDRILSDISKNPEGYSQEIQDAYSLVNVIPIEEPTQ
ncbi:MAG: hypothetical protein GQ477_01515 [Nanohaloarchaea archaeon]|nr:hypothetical protein [Candidatus Nanohaloarchaea archaeon]